MVTRLVSSLGVRNTRRVLQALGEGAAQGPSTPGRGPDRRTFLRGVASGAGLAASAVFLGSSSPASALAGPEVTTPADRAALLSTASRWSGRQEAAKQLRQRGFDREPVDRVALGSATDGVVMAFYGKGEDPDAAAIVTINIVGSDVRGGVEFVTVDLDALFTADGALNVGAMNVTPLQMPGEVSAAGAGSFFACMMLCMGATCASRAFKCKNLIFTSAVLLCIVASCGQQAYTCARRC